MPAIPFHEELYGSWDNAKGALVENFDRLTTQLAPLDDVALLTSTAARILGDGQLRAQRTVGGVRLFRRADVLRLKAERELTASAQANELIAVCLSSGSTTQGYTTGLIGGTTATNLFGDAAGGSQMTAMEDLIVSSIQTTITASMNFNSAPGAEIGVATFKAAAGGGGGTGTGGIKQRKLKLLDGNQVP
jgi:hypothetical protein